MEDWQRRNILLALNEHFLGKARSSVVDQVVQAPAMFSTKKEREPEVHELCWSRLDYFPGTPRAMFLTAGNRAKGRNVFGVLFNLDSGQVLDLNMARGPSRIRIAYDVTGLLVQGERNVATLARRELDDFLLNLCRSTRIKVPFIPPLLERN